MFREFFIEGVTPRSEVRKQKQSLRLVLKTGFEPAWFYPRDFKSLVYAVPPLERDARLSELPQVYSLSPILLRRYSAVARWLRWQDLNLRVSESKSDAFTTWRHLNAMGGLHRPKLLFDIAYTTICVKALSVACPRINRHPNVV